VAADPSSAAANFYLGYTIYKIAEPKRPFHPDKQKAAELFAEPNVLAVGFVLSFLSGLAAVAFMVRFLRGHSLNWFVAYRLVLAALIVVGVVAGVL